MVSFDVLQLWDSSEEAEVEQSLTLSGAAGYLQTLPSPPHIGQGKKKAFTVSPTWELLLENRNNLTVTQKPRKSQGLMGSHRLYTQLSSRAAEPQDGL